MLHTVLKIPVKGIHQTFIVGQSFKRNGMDKVCGIFRHDHMDISMKLYQHAGQIGCLISRNTSCHSQNYGFSFQHIVLLL